MPDLTPTLAEGCDSLNAESAFPGASVTREVTFCPGVPGAGARVILARPDLARAVCATCSVAGRCLGAAMAEESYLCDGKARYGVRGGLTSAERASLALGAETGVAAFVRFAGRRVGVPA